MKKYIVGFFLWVLNSRFLNVTPCKYGFIGNIDAFSYETLASEERQRPGITVRTILSEADSFRLCPVRPGLTVIESDGTIRDADFWDHNEIKGLGR